MTTLFWWGTSIDRWRSGTSCPRPWSGPCAQHQRAGSAPSTIQTKGSRKKWPSH